MFAVGLDALTDIYSVVTIFKVSKNSRTLFSTVSCPNPGNSPVKYNEREVKEILFGTMLGDGYLELPPRGINARFSVLLSTIAKPYFFTLVSIFEQFCVMGSQYTHSDYFDARTKKTYSSMKFRTRALPLFTLFFHMFYLNKKKIVPISLEFLTPLALAHWIMQDGSFGSSKGLYLCTDSFKPEDVLRLANHLRTVFNLKCTLPQAPGNLGLKGHVRIYISATSVELVRSLVLEFMVPSMFYKLGL